MSSIDNLSHYVLEFLKGKDHALLALGDMHHSALGEAEYK